MSPRGVSQRAMGSMPSFEASHVCLRPSLSSSRSWFSSVQTVRTASKERLACWLLMMRDRVTMTPLQITQNLIAEMLGGPEANRHECAGELERAGLIARAGQQLTIL